MESAFQKLSKANPIAKHFAYERQAFVTESSTSPNNNLSMDTKHNHYKTPQKPSKANPIARHYAYKTYYFMKSAFQKPSKANPIAKHFAYERQAFFTKRLTAH